MRSIGWVPAAGVLLLAACGGDNGGDVSGPPPGNTPPTANFGVTCADLNCTFSDSSSDADGSIAAWQWDFGDSTTSTDQNPVHTYGAAQNYNATLIVTDNGGAADTVTKPVELQPTTVDLTCTDAATPGAAATCSFTLPQEAGVRATLGEHTPCEAHGDVFAFTAPVVDTLTTDGCFAPPGTQVELPASPTGTQVSFEIRSGLTQFMTAIHVSGAYPEWTLNVEDAVGAPFEANFEDMIVTLTVLTGP